MRLRKALSVATLLGSLTALSFGCGEDVSVAPATGEVKPAPVTPESEIKGVAKKAIGAGSSANIGKMGKNPMDATK